MTVEVFLLALATTVRPTSLAAVYALLAAPSPRRLMIVYVAAGMAFTIGFGLLIIWAFHGIDIKSGSDETKGIAQIAGGIVILIFAVGVLTRRIGGPHADDAPEAPRRWSRLLEHRLTLKTAAVAGPATHVPGLFYLVALNVIVAHQPKVPGGLFEVLLYNVVWFAIPLIALAICIVEPDAARAGVGAIERWTKEHTRAIFLVAAFAIGAGLVLRGLLAL